MASAEEYLTEKHMLIEFDYSENGNFPASCIKFALEIANILLKENKKPEIYTVRKTGLFSPKLVPLQYHGKTKWNVQNVCCVDGFAYDPVLGKPVKMEDYCILMFGRKYEMKRNPELETHIGYNTGCSA